MLSHNNEPSLRPIWIEIVYAPELQFITGKARERSMCNERCAFLFLLQTILREYPAVMETYPPGVLGFTVNGEVPSQDYAMHDGDVVAFMVCPSPTSAYLS